MSINEITNTGASRRGLLAGAGKTLSLTALGLITGGALTGTAFAKKAKKADPAQDIAILNAAIALEHEGIGAYQLAAGSGLLTPGVLQVGVTFQSHHKEHRDALIGAVRTLGGTAVEEKPLGEYAASLNAGSLKNQEDVLRLALRLETGATNAYLGLIPALADFHLLAARLAGDEAYHVAVLAGALGEPIPKAGFIFGA
jgi:hypothetical protein